MNEEELTQEEEPGIKISEFPAASALSDSDVVTGLQSDYNVRFTLASILSWIVQRIGNAFVSASRTINGKSLSSDIILTASDVGARPDTWTPTAEGIGAIPASEKGEPLGVPELDSSGKVPSSQLPTIPSQPSDIGAQAEITASGILKGDGAGGVSAATPGTDYATPAMIPTVPSAYTSNPAMDGTVSPGSSGAWARGDHVHPTDTSRAPSAAVAESLFQTATDIHGDTTVTLTKSFTDYAYLAVLVTPDSANTTLTRTMLMIPVNMLNLMPNVPVVLVDSNAQVTWGYMTIGLVSTTITNQLRFRRTSFSNLYLQRINGIR